jgi:hypothetical protein
MNAATYNIRVQDHSNDTYVVSVYNEMTGEVVAWRLFNGDDNIEPFVQYVERAQGIQVYM